MLFSCTRPDHRRSRSLAFFVGPPALDKPPDPSILHADPRPDWYLLWYFALLALIPARIEGYVMIRIPDPDRHPAVAAPMLNHKGERAASRRPWAIAVVCLSVIMIGALWWEGSESPWSPNFDRSAAERESRRRDQRTGLQGRKIVS